jgi:hypothetical protein
LACGVPKGLTSDGLRLEYAVNGDLKGYLEANPDTSLDQRLRWCKQAAEAVGHVHRNRVTHCHANPHNLLLDQNLDSKLADFQRMFKSCDEKVLLDGLSRECTNSFLLQNRGDHADVKADLFALRSGIYFIMMRHEFFLKLDSNDDDEEVKQQVRNSQFPVDPQACSTITVKCWTQKYSSAQEVVENIIMAQNAMHGTGQDSNSSL